MLRGRATAIVLTLATTSGLAACTHARPPWRFDGRVSHFIDYTERDDRILARRYQNWARLEYAGPRDHPVVILWVSPALYGEGAAFNEFVVLTPSAWARTQLRLSASPCPPLTATDYPVSRLTVAVAGHVTQHCLAKQDLTCAYAEALHGIAPNEVIRGDLEQRETFDAICATGVA